MLLIVERADAHRGCHTKACVERVAAKRCNAGRVSSCIHRAALRYRVSWPLLRRIAWCESGLRPRARHPEGASGLMQFLPSTFAGTPYARRPILSAKWNALAGAWLLARAGTRPWYASRHCWASLKH